MSKLRYWIERHSPGPGDTGDWEGVLREIERRLCALEKAVRRFAGQPAEEVEHVTDRCEQCDYHEADEVQLCVVDGRGDRKVFGVWFLCERCQREFIQAVHREHPEADL